MPRCHRAALAAVFVVFAAAPAAAATIEIGQAFGPVLQPYIDAAVEAGLAVLGGWVLWVFKTKLHVDVEGKHREVLKSFAERQAGGLVKLGAVKLNGLSVEINNSLLAAAVQAAPKAIADAMSFFGLTPQNIKERIEQAVPKEPAIAQALAVAVDVANPATPSTAPVPPPLKAA